jgi:SAM-dependent methyltransferase
MLATTPTETAQPIPVPPPAAHRRYLSTQADRYAQFLQAAEEYAKGFEDRDDPWMHRKPFDPEPGNSYFYSALYGLMNLLRVMELPPGGRVLEVGSGPGWLTEILVGLGFHVTAVEPSAAMIRLARRRLELFARHHRVPEPLAVEFRCEPVEECSLPDESVDGVIFYESLHHVVDERRGLAQCFRALKPGGVLGVTNEGAWRPGSVELEAAIEDEMARFGTLENPYTPEYLDYLLAATGFEHIVRYHSVNGFFPESQGRRTLAEAAQVPAGSSNHLTAHKPYRAPTTACGLGQTLADVRVLDAAYEARSRQAVVGLELTNRGDTIWLARHPSGTGYLTASVFRGSLGGSDFVECGRLLLPRNAHPGESVVLKGSFALPLGQPLDGWQVGLVNESLFWLADHGTPPVPVCFATTSAAPVAAGRTGS